jgi:hypothetical protein
MKLKYNCKVYDKRAEDFTTIPKDTEIKVLEVDRRTVKIEWEYKGKMYYGFIAHRQFMICVDENAMEQI